MKAIRKIDRALKQLYHLERDYRAEDFLVTKPQSDLPGVLYIRATDPSELSLGIYLNRTITDQLSSLQTSRPAAWSSAEFGAFTTATEEVSHFHYVLHHVPEGRAVSRLEMEMQGEIDKFLLAFFAGALGFEALVEQIFFRFHLSSTLSDEEKTRYLDANNLAKRFILKHGKDFSDPKHRERLFRLLRRFYRLSASEKIGLISRS